MLQKYQYHVKISLLPWLLAAVTAGCLVALTGLLVSPSQGETPAVKPTLRPKKEGRCLRGLPNPPRRERLALRCSEHAVSSVTARSLGVRLRVL